MKILFIGDIFAKAGRLAVTENLQKIIKKEKIDFTIANAENATHGRSLSQDHYNDLIAAGVDLITMGNHTWDTSEVYDVLSKNDKIIRPLNVAPKSKEAKHGFGSIVFNANKRKIRVTNVMSTQCSTRATLTNPFLALEEIIKISKPNEIHIVDFHAETTSEKNALLIAYAGKVSAILGTHTHVQTADEKIYKGTAFITDVGMCGAKESIIGAKPDEIVAMFQNKLPRFHLEPAKGKYQFNSVIIDFDDKTNKPVSICRYNINNN
ncbi:MAG: TIGR00282 family metallophosphoesterase [Mycoplasmoidaceae bacterium]|nr:TIGR00282 family metallophosphoesterase [Mycoplasmoidaceae bacterium]